MAHHAFTRIRYADEDGQLTVEVGEEISSDVMRRLGKEVFSQLIASGSIVKYDRRIVEAAREEERLRNETMGDAASAAAVVESLVPSQRSDPAEDVAQVDVAEEVTA